MQLFFKTLDHKTFYMEVDMDGTIEDLVSKIEDDMGRENLYKLIYAGKLLKEEKLLSDYKITRKIPIILMITKPANSAGNSKMEQEPIVKLHNKKKCEENNFDFAQFKRTRTVTEDSGFEEDFNSNHFVTEKEFTDVIEVIKTCEYLGNKEDPTVTIMEVKTSIAKYCEDEDIENMDLEDIILDKIDDIMDAKLNKMQLKALLEDIQSIYEESREDVRNVKQSPLSLDNDDDLISDEDDKEEDTNMKRLTEMGFTEEEAENALQATSNNLQSAVEFLVPTTENESSKASQSFSISSKSNPLAFLRDIEEFQFLRYLVLQDPTQLQPLLLSFGQSHPDIMKIIHQNKDMFVSMIHEQTGGRLRGRH
eukprot:GFUD01132437.1.p1 GENE.GFUD01132437.1~~GFUD01132437.1.p1  ORF type:complete len:365 (+),score=113.07 GFUD01132437.1:55-1149(+)